MPAASGRVLNPKQEVAAGHVDGPMLVRAGAGTGKTTVLVERICRLVAGGQAQPSQILAITYTREAAKQLAERATQQLEKMGGGGAASGLRATTFHASCFELLKRHRAEFDLLEKEDLWILLRRQLDARKLPLRHFLKAADPAKFLHDFLDFFERCGDELVSAGEYRKYVNALAANGTSLPRIAKAKEADQLSREEILERCQEVAEVYEFTEELLRSRNLGTYGSMIVRAVELLKSNANLLALEQQRTKFLLIDEFQDSNFAQIEFAELLTGAAQNVFAVGDPDQAIYRFRGASSAAFDEFIHRFKSARVVSLAENYRSTPPILKSAFALISSNPELATAASREEHRREPLVSARAKAEFAGVKGTAFCVPGLVIHNGAVEEAFDVAENIASQHRDGAEWNHFAILYRGHSHRAALIRELGSRNIPLVVVGVDLLETAALRDVVAVLRCLHSKADDISLFRLLVGERLGLNKRGPAELQRRLAAARQGTKLHSILQEMPAAAKLLDVLSGLRRRAADASVSTLLAAALRSFQFDAQDVAIAKFAGFVEKWEKLVVTETRRLPEFIEYLDYFTEAGGKLKSEKPPGMKAVQLMTIHSAKGLEFPHVQVLRVASGSFPTHYQPPLFEFPAELHKSRVSDAESKEVCIQEERRLLYVAMTRARDTLALHGKAGRGKERVPSLFLRELARSKVAEGAISVRDVIPFRVDIAAAAATHSASGSPWLQLEPAKPQTQQPLSHHALDLYITCPLQFKLARDWQLPSEPAATMQFGAAVHRVLSDYYRSVMAKRPYDEARLLEQFRLELADSGMDDPLQRELYERQGVEQLQRFFAESSSAPAPDVIGTEQSFAVEVGGARVVGRIDRIDRISGSRVAIVDYKTGTPKTEAVAKKSLQLSLYAIAVERQWGYDAERLVLHNLEDNSRVEVTRNAEQLAEAEEKVKETASAIRRGDFEPTPGFGCKWCSYRSLCPATEEKLYTIATAVGVQ